MTIMQKFLGAVATLALGAGAALADPAIIFDLGGKFDKSFNQSAFEGATRWAEETGGSFREIELTSEAQREQALRRFAEGGFNPIVMTGFGFASSLDTVAPDFPDTKFAIIDVNWLDQPNVRGVGFAEQEGSYLVGIAAAMASKSGTVSFVGGMDVPLIRAFACGYVQGVKASNPDVTVIQNMTGTTPAAWNDPIKGGEITKAQIGQGSDVVYAAAGGTGVGVLQTAFDEGIFSIGVDANQNYLFPGSVLTSMLKRVDNAVYDAFTQGVDLETGNVTMNIANGGIDYALDEYNAGILSADIVTAMDAAKAGIIDGSISVHDYRSDDSCPVS
ncbi:BMP family ABC transporter substrate-binding protein [Rhodobacteraceae bacterium R_SAG10]|jgi:basic membrane protein A|nr:BMP family ABC transporter substrate-binding protein [Rhodobacteraceae bacterium R_SAG10]